jgi:hypothetical protein
MIKKKQHITQTKIDKMIEEIGIINSKMLDLDSAKKVNYVFEQMDIETQEAVKSLINHLMVAKTKKEYGIE